jgi:hypothetical protein
VITEVKPEYPRQVCPLSSGLQAWWTCFLVAETAIENLGHLRAVLSPQE